MSEDLKALVNHTSYSTGTQLNINVSPVYSFSVGKVDHLGRPIKEFGLSPSTYYFQNTKNCQMLYGHGIDHFMACLNGCERPSNIALLPKILADVQKWCSKPLVMFDIANSYIELFKKYYKEGIWAEHPFKSTNGSHRVFLTLKSSSLISKFENEIKQFGETKHLDKNGNN